MRRSRTPRSSAGRIVAVRRGRAAGIERVVAGDHLQHQRVVGDGAGHRPDMVEREGEREDAAPRHQAVGRLQADDAAAARRIAHAAAGVAAQRHREQAGRRRPSPSPTTSRRDDDRCSTDCAPAATAGRSSARRWRTRASRACPARWRRRRAASATQTASAVATLSLQDLGMAGRRQAGDIDDVLDADRHAVQRPAQAARRRSRLRRPWPPAIAASPSSRMKALSLRIERGDALEQRLHQLDRRELPGGDRAARPRRRPASAARSRDRPS